MDYSTKLLFKKRKRKTKGEGIYIVKPVYIRTYHIANLLFEGFTTEDIDIPDPITT